MKSSAGNIGESFGRHGQHFRFIAPPAASPQLSDDQGSNPLTFSIGSIRFRVAFYLQTPRVSEFLRSPFMALHLLCPAQGRFEMNFNSIKGKLFGALLAITVLLGAGLVSTTQAQGQWPWGRDGGWGRD